MKKINEKVYITPTITGDIPLNYCKKAIYLNRQERK